MGLVVRQYLSNIRGRGLLLRAKEDAMEVNLSLNYDRHTVIDARQMIEKSKQLLHLRAWTMYKVNGFSAEEIAACLGVIAL